MRAQMGDITTWSILLSFLFCVSAYIYVTVVGRGTVARRVVVRTRLYILVAILTSLPYVIWSMYTGHLGRQHPRHHGHRAPPSAAVLLMFEICWGLLMLHGALNTVVYAIQSRRFLSASRRPTGSSFPSTQGGSADVSHVATTGGSNDLTRLDPELFPVAFASDPSIVSFSESGFSADSLDPRECAPSPSMTRVRSPSEADLLRALDEVYDPEDDEIEDEESLDGNAASRAPQVPLWRLRMERSQRISSSRRQAIVAYEEQAARSSRYAGCQLM